MDKSKLEALKRYYATQCGINATIELSTLRKLIALAERTTSPVSELTDEKIKEIAWQFQAGGDEGKFIILVADLPGMARAILAAAAPHAQAPVAEQRVNDIVTALYRRFKDWSKRGFGPDDVTWCEVKADVMALIAASQQAAEPVAWSNGCDSTVPAALRYLAEKPRPSGGEARFNSEHLYQLAGEIERMAAMKLYAAPAIQQPQDERAAFEEWMRKTQGVACKRHGEGYLYSYTDYAWMVWQARAALAKKGGAA